MKRLSWMFCGALLVCAGSGCTESGSGQPGAGPQGEKGDKGDTGAAGSKGDKGDPGVPGAAGPTGAMGPAGPMGVMGATGSKGDKGDPGATGATGATGAAGPAGATGATGPAGAKGDRGEKGDPGPQGPTGPAGSGAYAEDVSSFAGFTTATTTGAVTNGRLGMHAICAAAFPGSHLCHHSEYAFTNSALNPPTDGAWIDPSYSVGIAGVRQFSGTSCDSWTQIGSGYYGIVITAVGGVSTSDCAKRKAVACCNSPARTKLAGFTTATTSGNAGGRIKMHQLCVAEFPGSHLCHNIEYARSHSAKLPPTDGAWIDPSNGTSAGNARELGGTSCDSWTQIGSGYYGIFVTGNGNLTTADCAKAKSVACCQ